MKNTHSRESLIESLAVPVGIIMLIVWAVATFALTAPGWIHALLMLGVFSVFWGVVARATPSPKDFANREGGNRESGTGHRGRGH